jgi:hypothetical protein
MKQPRLVKHRSRPVSFGACAHILEAIQEVAGGSGEKFHNLILSNPSAFASQRYAPLYLLLPDASRTPAPGKCDSRRGTNSAFVKTGMPVLLPSVNKVNSKGKSPGPVLSFILTAQPFSWSVQLVALPGVMMP